MSWINESEVVTMLKLHDFIVDGLVIGRISRVKRSGHSQRGWYVLHPVTVEDTGQQALIGQFGYWIGAEPFVEKISAGKSVKFSKEQQDAIRKRAAEDAKRAEAERRAAAERAAHLAAHAWRKYVEAGESEYLKRKGVGAYGVRFSPSGNGTVAIPMQDINARVWGMQVIRGKDRGNRLEKQFWPAGLEMKGKFHLIGLPRDILLVAEGYATAATLHQATGLPVAVAFTAGNILPVCESLKKHYKRVHLLICSDDDYLTEGNPGCKKAESAALSCGGAWVKPDFPADRGGKKLTDFNDLAHFPDGGEVLVRFQIEKAIEAAGWSVMSAVMQFADARTGGVGERQSAVSVMALDDLVERFIPLDDGTGNFLYDSWTRKIVSVKQMEAVSAAGVRKDDIKRHHQWITRGAFYMDEVGFDPTEQDKTVKLNTWKGWPMQPAAGSCNKMLETLQWLCSKEDRGQEIYQYLMRWMAYPLQHPGAKMSSAVIMHGPQGTGKSAIFQSLAKIYGDYATILNQRGLEDKFNSDWADSKLFILAEEVVTRAEMWHIKNELKELVTGEWIRVNPKNIAAYRQRNQVNVLYLSNEGQPLPIENDDRRHLVIYTPPPLSEEFYDDLWREIDAGGVAAFYDYLLNLDLGDFHPKKRPPFTAAKQALINLSLPSESRFISDWIHGETRWTFCPCRTMDLYAAYLVWCRENGETRPRASNHFSGAISNMAGWEIKVDRIHEDLTYLGSTTPARLVLPPMDMLEKAGRAHDPAKRRAEWLTACVFEFAESSQKGEKWAA